MPEQTTDPRRNHGMVTVFNRTGQEVGAIIDGTMYAVPAGQPGGGPGVRVVPEHIARQLVAELPEALTLSAGGYSREDVARMRELPEDQVREFCARLMVGETISLDDFMAQFTAAGEADACPAKRGSAAGGKAA